MKNLPDKIYLNFNMTPQEVVETKDKDFHEATKTWEITWSEERLSEHDAEYVCKDVFVEKAEKVMMEWAGTYISKTTGGGVGERKVLATDLLNYFKKYVKE